jgi:hypothetical protein
MSELGTYRRVRGPSSGQGEMPMAAGTEAERLALRDYYRDPALIFQCVGPQVRRLLCEALARLADLEDWDGTRAGASVPVVRGSHPRPSASICG